MKRTLIIFLFFISINSFGQYKGGTIYFRDNSTKSGQVKIALGNKVKLKKNKEKQVFDHQKVKKVVFSNQTEYVYKTKGTSILLLKKDIKGSLELYSIESYTPGLSNGFGSGTYITYYIGEKNSDIVEKLPSNETSKRYRKIISKYVSGCNGFSRLIKDKKSIKKNFKDRENSITTNIIEYYNESCNRK